MKALHAVFLSGRAGHSKVFVEKENFATASAVAKFFI
jgi:hypothetical protein